MADSRNLTATTEDNLLADPNGWNSKPRALDKITHVLAGTLGTPSTDVKNILEEKSFDQYVFSSKQKGADVFYLFSSGSADTYQIESPHTQKELWDALKYDDWFNRLKLKQL